MRRRRARLLAVPFGAALFAAMIIAPPMAAAQEATPPASFEASRAIGHAAALAALGPRVEGSVPEARAASYCIAVLRASGYAVTTMPFRLPNGRISRNVIAAKPGRSQRQLVIGGHLDSKSPSPGANDNGSGVGVVLELARVLKDADVEPTVVFVLFGSEEMIGRDPNLHHFGSRVYVARLTSAQKRLVSGMVSVDMVGYGSRFVVRTMGVGPGTVQSRLRTFSSARGAYLRYIRDGSRAGLSDHEAFERARIPAAVITWQDDPAYHTRGDTAPRLQAKPVEVTGSVLGAWIAGMTAADLTALRP
ncbi:MAG TPA: M28 family peptidase [Coriobacteriia bacterium]